MASTENNNLQQEVSVADEKPHGQVREVTAASVALAAAVAEQKPNIWSPNMIKLYMIMSIGYRYVCSFIICVFDSYICSNPVVLDPVLCFN
jgi:hypothetical protein